MIPSSTPTCQTGIDGTTEALSGPHRIPACSPRAAVQREQLTPNLIGGDVCGPTVRRRHSRVKSVVCIGEPLRLRARIVEVRQRALLERLRRVFVAGNRRASAMTSRCCKPNLRAPRSPGQNSISGVAGGPRGGPRPATAGRMGPMPNPTRTHREVTKGWHPDEQRWLERHPVRADENRVRMGQGPQLGIGLP